MSKLSCHSSTQMPRETSIPSTGVQSPTQQSKRIPTEIKYTPTTSKQVNDPGTLQVYPPKHITLDH